MFLLRKAINKDNQALPVVNSEQCLNSIHKISSIRYKPRGKIASMWKSAKHLGMKYRKDSWKTASLSACGGPEAGLAQPSGSTVYT